MNTYQTWALIVSSSVSTRFELNPDSIYSRTIKTRFFLHYVFWVLMATDSSKAKELNWEKRFEIVIATAEGLVYLHENTKTRIIHRDIKASNILLDSRLRAKIADFGLARSFQEDKSHISTAIAGTLLVYRPSPFYYRSFTSSSNKFSWIHKYAGDILPLNT